MFRKAAADVLGLSDLGTIIRPEDYDKVDADDYVMHEDGEKIFFLIKSKAFCCLEPHVRERLDLDTRVRGFRLCDWRGSNFL